MNIKILGTGCVRCQSLEKSVKNAVKDLKMDVSIEKVEDMSDIVKYGILRTPGLVINENVVVSGRTPELSELKEIISKYED
jgi:small redox-active disulfide protein 2